MQVCRERDELQEKVSAQSHAILSLQQEAESSSQALSVAGADATRLRSKVAQLQGMLDAGNVSRTQRKIFNCTMEILVRLYFSIECKFDSAVCMCTCVLYRQPPGERGREQIERERRKETKKVEKSHSVLSQSANRIGLSPNHRTFW